MESENYDEITGKIIKCAIEVHKNLGAGLLESVYAKCLEHEFKENGIRYKREVEIPFNYKGEQIDCKVKCDFLIENLIVLELKSVNDIHNIHKAQTMNYMNLLQVHKAILVNFNVYNLYNEGTETFVSRNFENLPR